MQFKRFYILLITLSFLISDDITSDGNSQSKEEKKWWSLFKKKDKSNDTNDVVEDEGEEEIDNGTKELSDEEPKLDKKQKKKEEKRKKKEEKKRKKEEKKKKKEEAKKDKKGIFGFLKKKPENEDASAVEEEADTSDPSNEVQEDEVDSSTDSAQNSEQPISDSIPIDSEDELIQAIIEQNKKIDLLIKHLDPSDSISNEDDSEQDTTDMLELLQIVQNKFNEIDVAVSGSDSLFSSISEDMKNLQSKIESINIRLETKIQSIEMSSSIYADELDQKIKSLEEEFSADGIQELKDMNKDLILKMLKVDDKYSSEITRLENKISNLESGVSNLKEINKDLVVNALTQPKENNNPKPINNSKKSTSNISKSVYKKKYDEAYLAYLDANYEKSLSIFEELLALNGVNDLTDNCQYWVGEIHYSMKSYGRAIDAFNKVFNYDDNNKGAYAYYKLGLCYLNISDTNKAVESFTKVVNDYSNQSDLVKKSEQFISKYSN